MGKEYVTRSINFDKQYKTVFGQIVSRHVYFRICPDERVALISLTEVFVLLFNETTDTFMENLNGISRRDQRLLQQLAKARVPLSTQKYRGRREFRNARTEQSSVRQVLSLKPDPESVEQDSVGSDMKVHVWITQRADQQKILLNRQMIFSSRMVRCTTYY